MIERKILISGLIGSIVLFSGCAGNQQNLQVKQKVIECNAYTGAPSWVIDPSVEDGVGVLGISSKNSGGASFQESIARIDAYHKAANEIKTLTVATLDSSKDSARNGSISKAKEAMKEVTALEVNSINISGLKRKNVWISECTGDMFTHYVMRNNNTKSNIEKVLKKVNADNRIIDNAMDSLEKDITKIKNNAKNR